MNRIKIDLSQVLSQHQHQQLRIWLLLDENFSTAKDIITHIKKKYEELKDEDLILILEDFVVPPDEKVNIFTQNDIVTISTTSDPAGIRENELGIMDAKQPCDPDAPPSKPLVPYSTSSGSSSSNRSFVLSQANVSTTGVDTEVRDNSLPSQKPHKWEEQFSCFLKEKESPDDIRGDNLTFIDPYLENQAYLTQAYQASKVVTNLSTEANTFHKTSSVKEEAGDLDKSLHDLTITSNTDNSDQVMTRKKRSAYLPWYNSAVSQASVRAAKMRQCEAITKKHEELGPAWTVDNTYRGLHYEAGHEDMMWVCSNSPVLEDINNFMQVNIRQLKNLMCFI